MLRHRWFIPAYVHRASRLHRSGRVGDVLEGRGQASAAKENAKLVAVLSSDRMPDLASRLRRDLQAEGVVISEMGKASSGRHTVMTLRLPSGAKSALEQPAARLQVSISFVAEAGSR